MSLPSYAPQILDVLGTDWVGVALPAAFLRYAVCDSGTSRRQVLPWALLCGAAALAEHRNRRGSFECTLISYVFSYLVPLSLGRLPLAVLGSLGSGLLLHQVVERSWQLQALHVLAGLCVAWLGWQLFPRPVFALLGFALGAAGLPWLLLQLLPVHEFKEAFEAVELFLPSLRQEALVLLMATVQIQVGLGYLGVALLRRAQQRKNLLLAVDRRAEVVVSARHFAWQALHFVGLFALPYMAERTLMENVNTYTFSIFANKVESSLRIHGLFPEGEVAGSRRSLLSAVASSNLTVSAYADQINSAVASSFEIIKREVFSLPKLAYLPGILVREPLLLMLLLPANIGLDLARAKIMAHLNSRIEEMRKDISDLGAQRQDLEQHDVQLAEELQRGNATRFAERQWRRLHRRIAERSARWSALKLFKNFIDHLYTRDFVAPGIECAMAYLLQCKAISAADIWVFTRVVEDALVLVLVKSRQQPTLASLRTQVGRLRDLSASLAKLRAQTASCEDGEGGDVRLRGFAYRRGQVSVRFEDMTLEAGKVYAVTGPNGCGKSSFFGLLAACAGHSWPPGLEGGQGLLAPRDVVEVTQQPYCPLFTAPTTWLRRFAGGERAEADGESVRHLAELGFQNSGEEEEANWYGKISGGQRSKAELVGQVFMRDRCPAVLLIDEALAPLDSASKALAQRNLKAFCNQSVVLAIHHLDAHSHCVASGFFDDNLHFANGVASLVGTCGDEKNEGSAGPGGFFHDWTIWTCAAQPGRHHPQRRGGQVL
ncbi:unnamed protein product [Effrenium voratum]|nr:unnamed protein product [Effrenium voratum]